MRARVPIPAASLKSLGSDNGKCFSRRARVVARRLDVSPEIPLHHDSFVYEDPISFLHFH